MTTVAVPRLDESGKVAEEFWPDVLTNLPSAVASAVEDVAPALIEEAIADYTGVVSIRARGAVGDGTDESDKVQDAVDYAASIGQSLEVDGHTYRCSNIVVPAGMTIFGDGWKSVLKLPNGSTDNVLVIHDADNVTIRDLTIDGNKANTSWVGGIVYHTLQGIHIKDSDHITVSNCWIHHAYSAGIQAWGSTNLLFEGCLLQDCGDNQIFVRVANVTPFTPCDGVIIKDCIAHGGRFSGIQTLGAHHVTISGCITYENGLLEESDGQGDGIGCEGGDNITIVNNVSYDNAVQGIQIRQTIEMGPVPTPTVVPVRHLVVDGNTVYGHDSETNGDAGAIQISDAYDVVISNNVLHHNVYGINVTTQDGGVGVHDLTIIGNLITDTTFNAIRLTPGNTSKFVIGENTVTRADVGIFIAYQATVKGNHISGSGNHGITVYGSGADKTLIMGNVFEDNTDNGILVDDADHVLVTGNTFRNVIGGQARALYETGSAGPTTMIENVIIGMTFVDYYFSHIDSMIFYPGEAGARLFKGPLSAAANFTLDAISTQFKRIRMRGVWKSATSSRTVSVQVRAAGTPDTSSNYGTQLLNANSSSPSSGQTTGTTSAEVLLATTEGVEFELVIANLGAAFPTRFRSSLGVDVTVPQIREYHAGHNVASAFNGFRLTPSGSTLTSEGDIEVWGEL